MFEELMPYPAIRPAFIAKPLPPRLHLSGVVALAEGLGFELLQYETEQTDRHATPHVIR